MGERCTGEVVALSWEDLDFEERMIKVVAAMESGKDELKAPKTAAGFRKVPIPDEIYYDLLERKGDTFDPVFVQQTTGRRHTECSRGKAWKNIIRQMDIAMGAKVYRNQIKISVVAQDLCPYCLRHTYCTDLQNKGVPINVAKYLMGHSDISVTANIYECVSLGATVFSATHGFRVDRRSLTAGPQALYGTEAKAECRRGSGRFSQQAKKGMARHSPSLPVLFFDGYWLYSEDVCYNGGVAKFMQYAGEVRRVWLLISQITVAQSFGREYTILHYRTIPIYPIGN